MRGFDRQLRVWLTGNVAGPLLLWWFDTDLTLHMAGALESNRLLTGDRAYMILLACSLGLVTWMYCRLYESDPGSPDSLASVPNQSAPCKCVVKFDHYCMLINSSVGDKNHALFWGYCTLQLFLVMWGWMLAWHAVRPCYNVLDMTPARTCWRHSPLRGLVLLWAGFCLTIAAIVFTMLVVFHTYLAATNQSTYEMLKNSSVPYLKPYYDELRDWQPPSDPLVKPMPGQKRKARLPVGWVMVYRHLSGKGSHPRPFDQGLSKNLELFFFTPKPCVHKAQFEPGTMITGRAAGSDQV